MHAHLSRDVREHFVAIFQFDPKHGVGERLHDGAFQYDCVFFWFCQWNLLLRDLDYTRQRAQSQPLNLADTGQSTNCRYEQSRLPLRSV